MICRFPKDFWWGSSVWAQGTEGCKEDLKKAETVFEYQYRRHPELFYERQGPDKTLDWRHRYREYIGLLAKQRHNSFRTSISWARLMPDLKQVDAGEEAYYRDMLLELKKQGMHTSIVLYWFDMPAELEKKEGGFRNREVIFEFLRYCNECFRRFDGLVDIWYVFNEPGMDTSFKYLTGTCYPGIRDFAQERQAAYHMVLAQAMAIRSFEEGGYHGKIGSVINDTVIYPRSSAGEDLEAAAWSELIYLTSFKEPMINGTFPKNYFGRMKELGAEICTEPGDRELIKEYRMQVLGINYYGPDRVKAVEQRVPGKAKWEQLFEAYELPGRMVNADRGWEIYPRALYELLKKVQRDYGNLPCYICENGIGVQKEERFRSADGKISDDYRIDYLKEHLIWAHRAIEEGVNLKGYHVWSAVDLWSPTNQFKNLYGLVEYDRTSGEVRPKKSSFWYTDIIEKNEIDAGEYHYED